MDTIGNPAAKSGELTDELSAKVSGPAFWFPCQYQTAGLTQNTSKAYIGYVQQSLAES